MENRRYFLERRGLKISESKTELLSDKEMDLWKNERDGLNDSSGIYYDVRFGESSTKKKTVGRAEQLQILGVTKVDMIRNDLLKELAQAKLFGDKVRAIAKM